MVDELAGGLALLGQDVWVVSPYYDRNRKGEIGYLSRDPAGINHTFNVEVKNVGGKNFVVGIHQGVVNNVKVIFLHNSEIFPLAYADLHPAEAIQQLTVFAKASFEFMCHEALIPALCVTNDWFTGLIPGYAKNGTFGETFKGTTFFHICHNLEPTYEGRIFPKPNEGSLEHIY